MTTTAKLDAFTRAYLDAALWTSDPAPRSGEWCESDRWHIDAIFPAHVEKAIEDCRKFQEENRADLDEVSDTFGASDSQHGHDFWLTRNGHGAGFWARGYGDLGDKLSKAARAYGELNVLGPETTDQGNSTDEQLDAWDGVIYVE
jgi:hypothetical protein